MAKKSLQIAVKKTLFFRTNLGSVIGVILIPPPLKNICNTMTCWVFCVQLDYTCRLKIISATVGNVLYEKQREQHPSNLVRLNREVPGAYVRAYARSHVHAYARDSCAYARAYCTYARAYACVCTCVRIAYVRAYARVYARFFWNFRF